MFLSFFHATLYDPIYNALIFLVATLPYGDVGLAIIILTVVVKLVLFPLSLKAARTQILLKELEPALKEIREKYKDNREEQARRTLSLYKDKGLNPFAMIAVLLIQIPIILALYLVFFYEELPQINTEILYAFVSTPESVNLLFLGFIAVTERSVMLALLAGVTQFFQIKLTLSKNPLPPKKEGETPTLMEDFQRNMHLQMQYVLPVIIFGVSWTLAAAIPLYFIVSNLFAIGQELYIHRALKKERGETPAPSSLPA